MVPEHSGKLLELEARDFINLEANESFKDHLQRKTRRGVQGNYWSRRLNHTSRESQFRDDVNF